MRTISILFLMMTGIFSVYAQDVITLKDGNQINVKVTEISSSEIKYKRFDNLEGPTVVVPKADVFAITYENGVREVINAVTAPAQTTPAPAAAPAAAPPPAATPAATTPPAQEVQTRQAPTINGPHSKNFYTGFYLNPLGFISVGPVLGTELTFARHFIVDAYLRFPKLGLLTGFIWEGTFDVSNISGIGVGISPKFFTGKRKGGFYVGPMFEYWTIAYDCYGSDHWEGTGIVTALNLGYKFQFSSGFYMRTGAALGASFTTSGKWNGYEDSDYSDVFYLLDFSLGIAF